MGVLVLEEPSTSMVEAEEDKHYRVALKGYGVLLAHSREIHRLRVQQQKLKWKSTGNPKLKMAIIPEVSRAHVR